MKNKHVLLIDDSPTVRVLFKDLLESIGATVVLAENAEEGMELCRSENPDCILLDYQLPRMSGLELLARLRGDEAYPSIPVVMLSGEGDEAVAVEAMKCGALDYLVKGNVTPEAVERALLNAIDKSKLYKKLQEKNQELEEFVYTAAHDLRAPLVVLQDYSARLKDDTNNARHDRVDEFTDAIEDSSTRMMKLIENLLEYTRAGRGEAPRELLDLTVIAGLAVDNLGVLIKEANAQVDIESLPSIRGDQTALIQLFQNLVANAIKFRGDDAPIVRISAQQDDGNWSISIEDNGIGIAPRDQVRVFSPLKRLHSQSQYEGCGIGLATCKKVVKQHGGHIWVESQKGDGATFHFTLVGMMSNDELTDETQTTEVSGVLSEQKSLTFLVVEDDDLLRSSISSILEGVGANVLTAVDGVEALVLTEENHLDCVALDLQLPKLSGIEYLRQIRAANNDVPVVVVSSWIEKHVEEQCTGLNVSHLLTKPVKMADLVPAITQAITVEDASVGQDTDQPVEDREGAADHNRTVLIIDDDPRFSNILMDIASENGFKPLVARDGRSGLAMAIKVKPDAIVLDLMLPDVHGSEVFKSLKRYANTQNIPVQIISTIEEQPSNRIHGAIGYVLKQGQHEPLVEVFERFAAHLSIEPKEMLVVDDDSMIQDLVAHTVGRRDLKITRAMSGDEGFTSITTHRYDCIILDWDLGDMTGMELLEELDDVESLILPPIILYTSREFTSRQRDRIRKYTHSIVHKGLDSRVQLVEETSKVLDGNICDISATLDSNDGSSTAEEQDEGPLQGKKILVVDDDTRSAYSTFSDLRKQGAAVVYAENGKLALDALDQDEYFDLVILDTVMAGIEATKQIRNHIFYENVPILACSSHDEPVGKRQFLEAGANAYIAKGSDADELITMAVALT